MDGWMARWIVMVYDISTLSRFIKLRMGHGGCMYAGVFFGN